ncbi:MAG: serine/threonine protein kinase, partial [Planctomycetes bacterium]|nr:serine/threonine protein kinase [Planctomycetota bacterium]
MSEASQRDPLDLLIEQFLELHRGAEPLTVEQFAARHPEHAEQLRDLLPTLLALEDVKRDRASSGSGQSRASLPDLDRLGDFRIERELGRGGMGVVFEAIQESLNRRVALKVMPQASLLSGNQLERFQREARIAAGLHHTNIVPVYGSGESDGYHWYAMQYIAGQSLDRWRDEQSARPPEGSGQWATRARFVARIGAAAASALHCAHGHGTLHRDVKPGNFLLDREDNLWVTDFGLAKALEGDGLTNSGDLVGTLQYMAPEQFAGEYDVRSEVYALGVTLYEMLTLQSAFQGRHRSELMERVRDQRIEPLPRVCPEVPADLAVVIGKAMAREPGDRYRDAHALQQDLEAFLEDRPIQARRLSSAARVLRWCRRNRGLSTAIGAAALAIVGAAVSGWAFYGVAQDALIKATRAGELAKSEGERAEANLQLSLAAFGDVFDALVGRDAALDYEEDPDTGEQTVVVQSAVSQDDVVLLQKMLAFYDQFATENAESQSLRYETARANRRVGAIHTKLDEPGSLAIARAAFEKALAGFAGIDDRDVRRDVAQVHIDLGLLSERLRRSRDAVAHFGQALTLLQELPNAESSSIRLRRANVLFRIYRNKGRARRRGEGPWNSEEFVAAMA